MQPRSNQHLVEDIRIASTWRSFSTLEGKPIWKFPGANGFEPVLRGFHGYPWPLGLDFPAVYGGCHGDCANTIRPLHRLTGLFRAAGPAICAPLPPVPTEMAPPVTSLNSLMTRLQKSLPDPKISLQRPHIACARHGHCPPQAEVTLRRVEKEENCQAVREMTRAVDESSVPGHSIMRWFRFAPMIWYAKLFNSMT